MSDKRDAKPSDEEHVRGQIAPPPDMSSCSDLLSTDAVADAELETFESVLREPLPEADARYVAESGCQRVVERIAAIGCELSRTSGSDPVLQGMVRPEESGDQPEAGSDPGQTATMTPDPVPIELPQLGEYQLLEKLGQGGMGAVYKARHTRLDKIVAVKVLPPERMTDPQAVARFEREMKAVGRVDHPNIVRAMDAREIDGTHFLVMEYAAGMDLGDVVLQTGGLRIADACEIVRQVAVGLQCAHENGLIHRDIKPSNAILTHAGEVKILDLGLARLSAAAEVEGPGGDMTSFGTAMGTADYIAPEQAKDSHTADIRADIYSLGCTLYTLLAGRPPFIGPKYKSHMDKITGHLRDTPPPIGLLRADVPPGLAMVINQMMAKDREDRYATPQDVVRALTPFVPGADLNRLVSEAAAMKLGTQPAAPSSVGTEPGVSSAMSDTARRGKQANNAPAAAEMAGANGLPQTQPFAVSLSRRSRKPRAKRASALPRSRVLIGLGLLGVAILAGVIVITIRNREGKKVGELAVSDDNRVEVSHRPDTASAKPAESPASALPTGQWTPLVKSEEDLKSWQKRGTGSVAFADGAVRVQDAALSYPTVAVDLVIRVNVKIEVNVQATAKLTLRETAAGSYAAVLEDGKKVAVGVTEGKKWRELKSAAVTLPPEAYVALEFSAEGETLTVSVGGQKVLEVRDTTHHYGSPGLAVANGATVFKDVAVKLLRADPAWPAKERPSLQPVNVLALIDPVRDAVEGEYRLEDGALLNQGTGPMRLVTRYKPPEEYRLDIEFEDLSKGTAKYSGMGIGLVAGGRQCKILVRIRPAYVITLLEHIDGRGLEGNPTKQETPYLEAGKPMAVSCTVRRGRITAESGGKTFIDWTGEFVHLGTPRYSGVGDTGTLFLMTRHGPYRITRLMLTPLSGPGTVVPAVEPTDDGARQCSPRATIDVKLSAGPLYAFALTPDGKTMAFGGDNEEAKVTLWDVKAGRPVKTLAGITGSIAAVAFSPDGQTVAATTSSEHIAIGILDVESGRLLRRFGGTNVGLFFHPEFVAFSSDGKRLAAANWHGDLELWDPREGKKLRVFPAAARGFSSLAYSPDGTTIAAGTADWMVRLWEVESGEPRIALAGHEGEVSAVAFSPQGEILASGSGDRTIMLWQPKTGTRLKTLRGHSGQINDLAFSPDARWLASASWDKTVRLWEVATGRQLAILAGHTSRVWQVIFAPDGKTLYSCSEDGTIRLWDVEAATVANPPAAVAQPAGEPARERVRVRIPAGADPPEVQRALAKAGVGGGVKPSTSGRKPEKPPPTGAGPLSESQQTVPGACTPPRPLSEMALVQKPARLPGIQSWTLETADPRGRFVSWVFSPDGQWLAVADGTIRLWNVPRHEMTATLIGHRASRLAWSPDGTALASADDKGGLVVWQVATRRRLADLRAEGAVSPVLGWSPDGTFLAVGNAADGSVWLWETSRWEPQHLSVGGAGRVWSLAWRPDSKMLASSGMQAGVKLWDLQSRQVVQTLDTKGGYIHSMKWSPDGSLLAFADSRGGTMHLWEAQGSAPPRSIKAAGPYGNLHVLHWRLDSKELIFRVSQDFKSSFNVLDVASGKITPAEGISPDDAVLDIHPGSGCLAIATENGVWIQQRGDAAPRRQIQRHPGIFRVSLSADGTYGAATDDEGNLWAWVSGRDPRRYAARDADLRLSLESHCAVSPDGPEVAVVVREGDSSLLGRVEIWGPQARQLELKKAAFFLPLAWSPDGSLIAGGSREFATIWNARTGQLLRELPAPAYASGEPRSVTALAWSPDGKRVAFGGCASEMMVYETDAWTRVATLKGGVLPRAIAWSEDGQRALLAAAGDGGKILVWDVGTQKVLAEYQHPGGTGEFVRALHWQVAGKTLISAARTETCFWNLGAKAPVRTICDGGSAISSDGKLLYGGGGMMRVRRLEDGELLSTVVFLRQGQCLVIGPDGHYRGPAGVEKDLVYVVQTEAGQETVAPEEFCRRFGWKNDPARVPPLTPPAATDGQGEFQASPPVVGDGKVDK